MLITHIHILVMIIVLVILLLYNIGARQAMRLWVPSVYVDAVSCVETLGCTRAGSTWTPW
jgi:hypothetical protein